MSTTTSLTTAAQSVVAATSAEWVKLRSTRFPWLALGASLLLMAGACAVIGLSVAASAANGYDLIASAPQTAADAATFAQLPLIIVAILVITGEYGSGAIRLTLRATPLRGQVLLAKSLLAAAVAFLAGAALAVVGMVVAVLALGDAASTTGMDEYVRTAAGAGGYLAVVAVIAVGIGTVLRSTLVTILVLSLVLLAAPTLTELGSANWLDAVRDYLPSTAGEVLTSPSGGGYGVRVAAAVLALWATVSQLVGYAALWLRDA
ncbi:ABC transporter permease [Kineococcus esterisolvens]|uniref:ABC transporter permease n=1 Tax=unclassified Kineococcus TaxID=2621656 RepID=UPI003D7E2ED6